MFVAGSIRRALVVAGSSIVAAGLLASAQEADWAAYGRDPGGERFSPLNGIHRQNVASLEVAWTFRTGDAYTPTMGDPTAHEATPLLIDDTLFLSTPLGRVIALDPVTGAERWAFDARVPRDKGWGDYASRGVSAWRRGADRRIFVATIDARLFALDATTGKPIATFGEQGAVDLRKGLRIPPTGFADYAITSPPAVIGDAVVVGSAVADGTDKPHPSGEVRAFHAVTGKLLWSWDPVPQDPDAVGANTWKNGPARSAGGANAWSVIVADVSRNLVFVPTSSPSHDYYGGERLGDNLFSDAVVALRADTGARVWHFQTVHHDLWDYDVASPPMLFDWRKDGRTVPAIAVASKTGHLFILDRQTGQPLIPVEERPVPRAMSRARPHRRRSPFRPRRRHWPGRRSRQTMRGEPPTRTARGAAARSARCAPTGCSRPRRSRALSSSRAILAVSRGAGWRTIASTTSSS